MGTMASDIIGSSGEFTVLPVLAANIDLRTTYPGYAASRPKRLPREIAFWGGALVVQMENGTNVTLPMVMAGVPWRIAPARLILAGSAATTIWVAW